MPTHASLRFLVLTAAMLTLIGGLVAPGFAQDAEEDVLFNRLSNRMRAVSEKVDPCVVQIFTAAYGPVGNAQGRVATFGTQRSSGSGVVIDPKGFIITNAHVVDGARKVQVLLSPRLSDRSEGESIVDDRGLLVGARIVGVDRETDLAVLKIENSKDLPYLDLGDSDQLFQGQMVFAFGSPP